MFYVLPTFEILMGGLGQKGGIGKVIRRVLFLKVDILFVDHTSDGQGFNGLEPCTMNILKILFGKGMDLRQGTLITQDDIAIIGKDHIVPYIRDRMEGR